MTKTNNLATQPAQPGPAMAGDGSIGADDAAVDAFAVAMKAKLAKKRAEGRSGWQDKEECGASWLSESLRRHVEKGDPVDVANFAMMLHQRGERITAQADPAMAGGEWLERLRIMVTGFGIACSDSGAVEIHLLPNIMAHARKRVQPANADDVQTAAAQDVLAERRRQIEAEGWTPGRDDQHDAGGLAAAAAAYALHAAGLVYPCSRDENGNAQPYMWPWDSKWWKPTTPRRDLLKAAALVLAEIERIDRAVARQGDQS